MAASPSRLAALYVRAREGQWSAGTDIDWSLDVPFGAPLPGDSEYGRAAFAASPMARYGKPMWDRFRWERQSWMISQFLHGEEAAFVAAKRLAEGLPDENAKSCAGMQAADEARHADVLSRYLREKIAAPYAISTSLAALLAEVLEDRCWDFSALGMQLIVEPVAMASFSAAESTFHDPLIRQITERIARDEARHVSFGILLLRGIFDMMTESERAQREEFILEAARLMREQFLLEDVWDRLGIDRAAGVAFADTNQMMCGYRRLIFGKVVSSLARIGLMTDRVRDGLARLDLLSAAARRA